MFQESLVFDEVLHLEAGKAFLMKHDFRAEPFNPPLAREIIAFPLLFNKNILQDPIYFWPRMIVVLFTLSLALLVFSLSRKLFGKKASYLALLMFIFEPNILAHGHYATTDMILTFFIFLSFYLYWLWRKAFTIKRVIIFAIVFGCALAVKISALFFLSFSYFALFLYEKKFNFIRINLRKNLIGIFIFVIFVSISIWSTYFFTFEPPLGYRFNPHRPAVILAKSNPVINFALTQPLPLGGYLSTIKQVFLYNYSDVYIKAAFLNGTILSRGGFIFFFPIAFLIKSQLFLLAFIFLVIIFTFRKKIKNNSSFYLLIPVIAIFFVMFFSKLDLGLRYILPIYPLLIVFSSQVVNIKIAKQKALSFLIIFLMLWGVVGIARVYPHYITFFNDLVGGTRNGRYHLVDSNLDWGQGLVDLARYQKENRVKDLQLAYFGTVDPSIYGIKYQRIADISVYEKKKIENLNLGKGKTVAITATCWYYCGYYKNPLIKDRKPDVVLGNSVLIFKN
ncbi:MAG: phospholipid carrier-dependent glycosyltransferase [Cyanobacteria bacterium]|nr:phospholipid carrier-dependent glycosyltransferase [Cyanobacteriota bacterium]